ncbi:MAG: M36 family metallopeptidase [Saprospiraceae bacterium]|nr:M36 family metallopeptidase [Saprospiraceae bacterium]MCF8250784.1 M36 family metallopeptidase [Saprospiraceae bacterium]MCF8281762.1 M36 family metallopeptidase [Bacteroidales bacterium]MCF8312585.1 M36 family metallopeptidase [Saprospiraceae bacterium]MCF8440914.1 M36 family metallopeptidase [Saprospiraceae bacterium]
MVSKSLSILKKHALIFLMLCAVLPLGAQVSSKADLAKQLLKSKSADQRPADEDLSTMRVSAETFSKKSGVTHLYFQQYIGDIPVHGAILGAHLTKGDEMLTFNSRFTPIDVSKRQSAAVPKLTQEQALNAAIKALGIKNKGLLIQKSADNGPLRETIYDKGTIAAEDIKVQLVYQPVENHKQQVRLAWQVEIYMADHQNWWLARMDAETGELLDKNNYVVSCDFGPSAETCHHEHTPASPHQTYFDLGLDFLNKNQPQERPFSLMVGNEYRVYPQPVESPNHTIPAPPADGRVLVADPASAASPFGWHDTNGSPGAEFTTTQGNNVHAYTDTDNNNSPDPGSSPDGGSNLIFDFPIDLTQPPSAYRPAAVTNLFYWNNYIHDFAYAYGFDEAHGNFQENNYGNGGAGSDYVNAECQDGGGTNNANFATPSDGNNPRMQMYIGTNPNPDQDGSLDNGVVAHEYAHGISNRFTGGPTQSGCLGNQEQMGEGWSDFYALMTTMEPGDMGTDSRGIGTYLFGQPANGPGIRPTPYSTNMAINPSTYDLIKTAAVPHGVGYVWCTMIWDLTWAMVDDHGQAAGFDVAMNLVNEGMAIQPCSPGFVDGRNAILAADVALYGGANRCRIWEVFARRGLGFSANQGSSGSRSDGTQAFDMPSSCILNADPATAAVCAPANAVYMLTNATGDPLTMSATGNPAGTTVSFSANPIPASGGTSNMTIGNTAGAAPGTYTITITGANGPNSVSTNVTLKLYNGNPAAPTLIAPANMATNQVNPLLTWNANPNAATYDAQVATDAGFTNIIANPTGLTTPSYQTVGLSNLTTYYWRSRGVNPCGTGNYSAPFSFTTSNIICDTYVSTDVPKTIPITVGTVTSTLTIPGCGGTISDLNVKNLNITHTWIDDLVIDLTAPDGTTVRLMNRPCDSENNILINFDDAAASPNFPCPPIDNGTYQPFAALSAFNGKNLAGTWTLTVADIANQDGGSLNAWGLEICYAPDEVTCFQDADSDSYGNPNSSMTFCSVCGPGYVSDNTDCNDANGSVNPGVMEICGNGIDDDCDNLIDEGCCPTGNILYVNDDAAGSNDGSSWANAYTSLQSALANTCTNITDIWVAKGTYKPTTGTDRNISFVMKNNIAIYGGLAGTEAPGYDMNLRNFVTNETILSGDIGAGGNGDNSYSVVKGSGTNNTAILDGFTVSGGNANETNTSFTNPERCGGGMYNNAGSPVVRYCTFDSNNANSFGGGMFNFQGSTPSITNCSFMANTANDGGGMSNYLASPNVTNSVFSGNTANEGGGFSTNGTALPLLTNCSFSGNSATLGGGIFIDSSTVSVKNSIVWGNSNSVGVDPSGGTSTFTNTIVKDGCPPSSTCTNVLNVDPLFILQPDWMTAPTTVGNLRLQPCSPAIDAGDDAFNSTLVDRDGLVRKFEAIPGGNMIDMGSYEYQSTLPDSDNDGVVNCFDNCPTDANADQADADMDGIGDVCDVCPNDPTNTCNSCTGAFSLPANGAATVPCPAGVTQPTPPTVVDDCGVTLTPTGPVVVNDPNPLTCEGTTTFSWTYTNNTGSQTWSFVYTVEREPFTVPSDGSATVACPALAVQPTPPVITDNCGNVLQPITVIESGFPTCEGTKTFTFGYQDCEGNIGNWSFVYTIERNDFSVPANGGATVSCPVLATEPTPPVVMSDCGEVLTPTGPAIVFNPNPLTCEGTKTYQWTYTDCEGNSHPWSFVYTIERNDFSVPANGSATVACPALAIAPAPPTVNSDCGEPITPTGPVVTNNPNPLTCEGTRTFTWTYTDCEGNSHPWSFVYTVERNPFTVPANGSATVACPANATQPTPPQVMSNCGEILTPTGPVVTNNPNPLTCEGTRTYTWTYTDCEGNSAQWSFVYTVVRLDFGLPADGGSTVACPDQTDVTPVPPVVTSNCGEVLTPALTFVSAKDGCEGHRLYTWTYTDCAGHSHQWNYTYTVEYLDFSVPASETIDVECPLNASQPVPPVVYDNCGNLLNAIGPVITSQTGDGGCEGIRTYAWTYSDCEGNTHVWSKTFNFLYTADFYVYPDVTDYVGCLDYAQPPIPPTIYDICGQEIVATGPVVYEEINATGCSGIRTYTYVYTDCGGHSHPWSFIYYINDDQPPVGVCPGTGGGTIGGGTSVDVTNLNCIDEVPCPSSYDFTQKVKELLVAGGFYDLCSGHDLVVTLDSWSALWNCEDPDGDGNYTFGRTFYFRIADQCGNEFPELCSVTYSGACQPLNTFSQTAWGMQSEDPYDSGINLQVIQTLLNNYGPLTVGGGINSLTLTDAQCLANLLPGIGGPGQLSGCNQTNCTGCNPTGAGGMGLKNSLATNAIAFMLNMRYNVEYNGLTMQGIRNQGLGCMPIDQNIVTCVNGPCMLHIFDQQGVEHLYPYTLGGLIDLVNKYLGGNFNLSVGQSGVYATALYNALETVNGNWGGQPSQPNCDPNPGASGIEVTDKSLPTGKPNLGTTIEFSLSPNPASREVTFKLAELAENQAVTLEIYNNLGQRVLRNEYGKVRYLNERIDLNNISNGLYIVSVKVGNERHEQKLVISKN